MSVFDPDSFMSGAVEGANSTASEPVPVGEFQAVVDEVKLREVERKDGSAMYIMDIAWSIQDQAVKEQLGRDKVICRQSLFLDMTPQNTLDMSKGKNVQLGKVRAALNQNDPMQPWRPAMLNGAGPAVVKVAHRADKNTDDVYAEVKAVTAPA